MKKFLLLLLLVPAGLVAQVWDDFSDGDFTSDPSWAGDMAHFKLSSSSAVPDSQRPALQLDAPASGTSCLALPVSFPDDLEWRFWAKMSFNSSASNFARIYLASDDQNLAGPLHGYFIQAGGSDDSVSFCRQDSLSVTRLAVLGSVYTGNSTNSIRFRVLRNPLGEWTFFADPAGGHALDTAATADDLSIPGGLFFGIYCQYTTSNISKFYFDDFYAGPLIVDSIPPDLAAADVRSPSEILLTFNEALDASSVCNTAYYYLDEIGNPVDASCPSDPSVVLLSFPGEMISGDSHVLTVTSVKDLAGNMISTLSVPVMYYKIVPYDIIITEIMPDPSPPVNLPEYEYLELYNRSDVSLKLDGMNLEISSSKHELPSGSMDPGEYLLLCDDDAFEYIDHLAPAVAVPSFVLPNSASSLCLRDTAGMIICYLQYDLSWYKNDYKSAGGWSLEMIDPGNPCFGGENWTASVAAEGGTPGKINSVNSSSDGLFRITGACLVSDTVLRVDFSESADSLAAADTMLYTVGPAFEKPVSALPVSPGFCSVLLTFRDPFSAGFLYELEIAQGLKNCTGSGTEAALFSTFALPEPVVANDIIINEVLFNPASDGVDYVELYNRSGKAIDLENFSLASVKGSPPDPPDTQAVVIISSCHTLLPGKFLLLTSDPEMVMSRYYTENPSAFMEMASFPSFNNDKGYVLLQDNGGNKIDGMAYSEEMHFLMLLSYDGVALERISPERPGDDAGNWHSAASTVGFGTPGYENSQYLNVENISEDDLSLSPSFFSPDGDGRDDNLGITYRFDSPGKLVTILIFSMEGRLARTLVNNEMPGTSGMYSWDGTLDDRSEAPDGMYVIYMEALGMDGKTQHYKKAGILARTR